MNFNRLHGTNVSYMCRWVPNPPTEISKIVSSVPYRETISGSISIVRGDEPCGSLLPMTDVGRSCDGSNTRYLLANESWACEFAFISQGEGPKLGTPSVNYVVISHARSGKKKSHARRVWLAHNPAVDNLAASGLIFRTPPRLPFWVWMCWGLSGPYQDFGC